VSHAVVALLRALAEWTGLSGCPARYGHPAAGAGARVVSTWPVRDPWDIFAGPPATPAQLDRYADAGVRAFLAAYRKH
jgi:hypothetical protein